MQSPYQIMQSKSKSPKSKILSQLSQLQTCNFNKNMECVSKILKTPPAGLEYNGLLTHIIINNFNNFISNLELRNYVILVKPTHLFYRQFKRKT